MMWMGTNTVYLVFHPFICQSIAEERCNPEVIFMLFPNNNAFVSCVQLIFAFAVKIWMHPQWYSLKVWYHLKQTLWKPDLNSNNVVPLGLDQCKYIINCNFSTIGYRTVKLVRSKLWGLTKFLIHFVGFPSNTVRKAAINAKNISHL